MVAFSLNISRGRFAISIQLNLSKLQRLKLLLGQGYFPTELPPVFQTSDLAKFAGSIGKSWSEDEIYQQKFHNSKHEKFSYPRYGYLRRNLAIVNPVPQFFLCKEIADNWVRIKKHLAASKISINVPIIAGGLKRAVAKPDFENIALHRMGIQARYNYTLTSDISRFYPTLYTHVIPWATEGKSWCKQNLHKKKIYNKSLGARLDKFVRFGQENQTIGIPIGPDTSRILSEIVMIGIEKEFPKRFHFHQKNFLRNVDDIYCGFSSETEADQFFSEWVRALKSFELEVNNEKTCIKRLELPEDSDWAYELSHFNPPVRTNERAKIRHFFDIAFNYARAHRESNVLLYAVKSSRGLAVSKQNWPIYEDYLLRAARLNSTVFPALAQILIECKYLGHPLDHEKITKLIDDTIIQNSPLAHHAEIAWALFIARGLKVKISEQAAKGVSKLRSSVCALLLLDMRNRGLVKANLNVRFWESFMDSDGLKSDMWLLSYEAALKGWLPSKNAHVDNDYFFSVLKKKKVSFYNEAKNLPQPKSRSRLRYREYRTNLLYRMLFNKHSL